MTHPIKKVALWAILVVAFASIIGLPFDPRLILTVVVANLIGAMLFPLGDKAVA